MPREMLQCKLLCDLLKSYKSIILSSNSSKKLLQDILDEADPGSFVHCSKSGYFRCLLNWQIFLYLSNVWLWLLYYSSLFMTIDCIRLQFSSVCVVPLCWRYSLASQWPLTTHYMRCCLCDVHDLRVTFAVGKSAAEAKVDQTWVWRVR